ncbi:unnamed protein product [Caenorhabditis brenneri]
MTGKLRSSHVKHEQQVQIMDALAIGSECSKMDVYEKQRAAVKKPPVKGKKTTQEPLLETQAKKTKLKNECLQKENGCIRVNSRLMAVRKAPNDSQCCSWYSDEEDSVRRSVVKAANKILVKEQLIKTTVQRCQRIFGDACASDNLIFEEASEHKIGSILTVLAQATRTKFTPLPQDQLAAIPQHYGITSQVICDENGKKTFEIPTP